jgi:hypothetical protein
MSDGASTIDRYLASLDGHRAEISSFLHPDDCCGYATEAAHQLLAFGFGELALHRITAQCNPRTIAAMRVLERVGMRYEGHLREPMRLRDGWRDSLIYVSSFRIEVRHVSCDGPPLRPFARAYVCSGTCMDVPRRCVHCRVPTQQRQQAEDDRAL